MVSSMVVSVVSVTVAFLVIMSMRTVGVGFLVVMRGEDFGNHVEKGKTDKVGSGEGGEELDGDDELDEELPEEADEVEEAGEDDQSEDREPATLLAIGEEPRGENCKNGGQKIQAGFDANFNNTLDEDEVSKTEYNCRKGTPRGEHNDFGGCNSLSASF